MIVVFTIVAAAAQVLFKMGADRLKDHTTVMRALTDVPLIAGLATYGAGAALMILALRHGELSVLYPIISLTMVWVAILAMKFFDESMNVTKIAGMAFIIVGVAILGRGGRE